MAIAVPPCPLCQADVEIEQTDVNRNDGTRFNMATTCYSQLMLLVYGGATTTAALDDQIIRATKIEAIAARRNRRFVRRAVATGQAHATTAVSAIARLGLRSTCSDTVQRAN